MQKKESEAKEIQTENKENEQLIEALEELNQLREENIELKDNLG